MKKNPAAVALGRRGGRSKSEAKIEASRANGKRFGGRKSIYPKCEYYEGAHHFRNGRCACGYKRVTWIKFVKEGNAK